jgi:hypothetical protein
MGTLRGLFHIHNSKHAITPQRSHSEVAGRRHIYVEEIDRCSRYMQQNPEFAWSLKNYASDIFPGKAIPVTICGGL